VAFLISEGQAESRFEAVSGIEQGAELAGAASRIPGRHLSTPPGLAFFSNSPRRIAPSVRIYAGFYISAGKERNLCQILAFEAA
jgi:hypothetical protein